MPKSFHALPSARSLAVFEAAGRLLNFSAVGRQIGMSQAAVSKQIQALEADIGVKLFTRSNRGLSLTNAGRHLHQAVSSGLGQIHDAVQQVRPRHKESRIAITTTIAVDVSVSSIAVICVTVWFITVEWSVKMAPRS